MKSNWSFLLLALLALSIFSCADDEKSVEKALASSDPQPQPTAVSNPKTNPQAAQIAPYTGPPRTAEQMVAAGYKRFGVEKGALIFRLDGAVNGTEHLFFDNWGWREAKYTNTTTTVANFHEVVNDVQYLDGERRYLYDPKTNKAKYINSQQMVAVSEKYNTKDMVVVADEMLKNMGAVPDGKAMVGKIECDAWVIERSRIRLYMWQGITMAEESYVNNIPIGRRCLQAELEKDIPMDRLLLPKGVEVAELKK